MARKSVLKRIKFTKTGKVLRRIGGKNHFNAKASRRVQLRRKKMTGFSATFEKKIRAFAY